jgi:hypothetical protein
MTSYGEGEQAPTTVVRGSRSVNSTAETRQQEDKGALGCGIVLWWRELALARRDVGSCARRERQQGGHCAA